jgi:hypothetical protein
MKRFSDETSHLNDLDRHGASQRISEPTQIYIDQGDDRITQQLKVADEDLSVSCEELDSSKSDIRDTSSDGLEALN